MPDIAINAERLLADLKQLRSFGAYRSGVHRPTYSPDDMAARHWLVGRMREAGLDAEMDGIGNILGRNPQARRRLLVGSHSDSQNHAGWLDGALGVIYGLEIARIFAEGGGEAGVDAVVFADEEAHFASFLGSRSAIGLLTEDEISAARNRSTGQHLSDALSHAGLAGVARHALPSKDYLGYIEAHIEQGDQLEAEGLRIGVVTSIVGINQYRITFSGERNHAGTTRMAIRKDAGVALIEFAHEIDARFRTLSAARTVWTVGNIVLSPGQVSIIPDRAEMLLQVRDDDPAILIRFRQEIEGLVAERNKAGPCGVTSDIVADTEPHIMDSAFRKALADAAEHYAPSSWQAMPSGAGHDAQILARVMPAAMLFVPSKGGISHDIREDTDESDIVLGCQVLAEACNIILNRT